MPALRAICIDEVTRWGDGQASRTPALTDMAALLTRTAVKADPAGITVLIGSHVASDLGFPLRMPRKLSQDHPTLNTARAHGWRVSELSPWMTFWRPRRDLPSVHLGVLPWLSPRNFPLLDPHDVARTVWRLDAWHRLLRVPFHGSTGGLAGIELMRVIGNARRIKPSFWRPNWEGIDPALRSTESAWHWSAEPAQRTALQVGWQHSYDANVQFLSAASHVSLATDALQHTSNATPTHNPLPGYYRITVPPWADPRLPHPAGPTAVAGERRWVSGPTLGLLHDLADRDQVLAMPEIHEAWCAGGRRELAQWAGRIRDALTAATDHGDTVLVDVLKHTYKHGIGMLEKDTSRVHRPDWAHAIIGTARASLWRRVHADSRGSAAAGEPARWPLAISADAVTYPSPVKDPYAVESWPTGFPRHDGPGGYKHVKTIKDGDDQ